MSGSFILNKQRNRVAQGRHDDGMAVNPPLVSVCIPLCNGALYIREAIESVLAQTLNDWELVITDDGSTDGSAEIIAAYSDPRIRYLRNPERLGVEGNWNRCVNEGAGIYRKLLCHDDRLHPECLARQVAVFEQQGSETISLVTAARKIIDPAGRTIMTRRWKRSDQLIPARTAIRQIIRSGRNPVGEPGSGLFRASDWAATKGFTARYPYVIDLDFWIQLLLRGDCFYLSDPLCDFRVSLQSWSFRLVNKQGRQFHGLVQSVARSADSPVTFFDNLLGTCKAHLAALFRCLIYLRLFLIPLRKEPGLLDNGFSCVLCGANKARLWLKECPDIYLRKGAPVDYMECAGCSLIQQHPSPGNTSALYEDYPVHTSRNVIQRLARRVFQRQVYFHPPAGFHALTLLDYGCGDGTFLREMKKRAGEVFGFEPGSDHAGTLAERLGVPVYSSTQTLCGERAGTVDAITAHFVLEHVPDLRGSFETFRTLLKPGGRLYVAVPNIRSWEARLFKRAWHGLDAPRHVVFPETTHFEKLAAETGLEIIDTGFAAFPNTLAASLSSVLFGRFHPLLLMAFTPLCWLIALMSPSGTRIVQMKKGAAV